MRKALKLQIIHLSKEIGRLIDENRDKNVKEQVCLGPIVFSLSRVVRVERPTSMGCGATKRRGQFITIRTEPDLPSPPQWSTTKQFPLAHTPTPTKTNYPDWRFLIFLSRSPPRDKKNTGKSDAKTIGKTIKEINRTFLKKKKIDGTVEGEIPGEICF